ncbi:MAG TPA: PqqD family protein [Methylomirabilota bacterium]
MIPAKASTTASRLITGEAVILSLDTKVLRGLNAVGSRVWELIDGHRTVDEIVDVIVAEFEVSRPAAAADLDAFFRQLIDKGLVTTA